MDDNNKQTSVISDQSSDKTSETEDQQINQSEAPIEEAKSETDKAIREMDNQAGDGEEGVPTRSRSEESSEDARRQDPRQKENLALKNRRPLMSPHPREILR